MEIQLFYLLIFILTVLQSIIGVGILVLGTPLLLIFNYEFIEIMALLLPISIAFFTSIYYSGFTATLLESSFDISYFNMVLPFLLLSLTFDYKTLLPTTNIMHLADSAKNQCDINKET